MLLVGFCLLFVLIGVWCALFVVCMFVVSCVLVIVCCLCFVCCWCVLASFRLLIVCCGLLCVI